MRTPIRTTIKETRPPSEWLRVSPSNQLVRTCDPTDLETHTVPCVVGLRYECKVLTMAVGRCIHLIRRLGLLPSTQTLVSAGRCVLVAYRGRSHASALVERYVTSSLLMFTERVRVDQSFFPVHRFLVIIISHRSQFAGISLQYDLSQHKASLQRKTHSHAVGLGHGCSSLHHIQQRPRHSRIERTHHVTDVNCCRLLCIFRNRTWACLI
jgi:hypothetical protein